MSILTSIYCSLLIVLFICTLTMAPEMSRIFWFWFCLKFELHEACLCAGVCLCEGAGWEVYVSRLNRKNNNNNDKTFVLPFAVSVWYTIIPFRNKKNVWNVNWFAFAFCFFPCFFVFCLFVLFLPSVMSSAQYWITHTHTHTHTHTYARTHARTHAHTVTANQWVRS